MNKENNLYNYKTPKSGNEESSFFLTKGRITLKALLLRFLFSLVIYTVSFFITAHYAELYVNAGSGFQESFKPTENESIITLFNLTQTLHSYIIPVLLSLFIFIQGAKRMHDINMSGWYFLIPVYNVYLAFKKGTKGSNDYGIDPAPIQNIQFFDEIEVGDKEDNETPPIPDNMSGLEKWRYHLSNVKKANPNLTHQDAVAKARDTYTSNNINEIRPLEIKKKSKRRKYVLAIVSIVILIMGYGVYEESKYPPNEYQLQNLLLYKYWKIQDASIEEIYLNDELVPNASSSIRNDIISMFDTEYGVKLRTNKQIYENALSGILLQKDFNSYIHFKLSNEIEGCNNDYGYILYEQYYDEKIMDLVFTESCMKMGKINNRFRASKENDQYSFDYFLADSHIDDFDVANYNWDYLIKSFSLQVDYIDYRKLEITYWSEIVIKSDEESEKPIKMKIKCRVSYKELFEPPNPPRFKYEEVEAPVEEAPMEE